MLLDKFAPIKDKCLCVYAVKRGKGVERFIETSNEKKTKEGKKNIFAGLQICI